MVIKLPQYGHLVAFGSPWFVHPPLFYLLQSGFFQLSGIQGVTTANVFTARLTSCMYASLTVVVMFVWIAKISEVKIAATAAFVLMFEPYALKFSRIGILESLVILFAIVSLYFFTIANSKSNLKNYFVSGVFFGLALLTKELGVFVIIVIAVWFLLTKFVAKRKVNLKGILTFLATALLMYLGYVVWALSVDTSAFLKDSFYIIRRAFWIVKDTGYTSPGYVSFFSDFTGTANLYIITYILLIIATISSIYLILKDKSHPALVLSSWFVGSAIFFGAIGIHNPQFFVYLTVPAAVIAGYTVAKLAFGTTNRNRKVIVAATLLILVAVNYNIAVWVFVDCGTDNAVNESVDWIESNVPNGEKLWAVYTYQYFLSNYQIVEIGRHPTLDSIRGQDIHYLVFSPRWISQVEESMHAYISEGQLVVTFYGQTNEQIAIYYISNPI